MNGRLVILENILSTCIFIICSLLHPVDVVHMKKDIFMIQSLDHLAKFVLKQLILIKDVSFIVTYFFTVILVLWAGLMFKIQISPTKKITHFNTLVLVLIRITAKIYSI